MPTKTPLRRAPTKPQGRAEAGVRSPARRGKQRAVRIGGEPLPAVGSRGFDAFVARHDLRDFEGTLRAMHTSASVLDYETAEDCVLDVKVRQLQGENMQSVEQRALEARTPTERAAIACAYPSAGEAYYLDSTYWMAVTPIAPGDASNRSPEPRFALRPRASPAGAIKAIFRRGPEGRNLLDCNAMMTSIHYKALLDLLGPPAFDTYVPGLRRAGEDHPLEIYGFRGDPSYPEHGLLASGVFERIDVPVDPAEPTRHLLPGDHVYFQNHQFHVECDPRSVWRGEHAIYLGDDRFTGFGVGPAVSYQQMQDRLLGATQDVCADHPLAGDAAQLERADIPGLDIRYLGVAKVYRLVPARLRAHILREKLRLQQR